MGFVDIGRLGPTVVEVITDSADTFAPSIQKGLRAYLVWSNRKVHLSKNDEASTDDFLLEACTYARVSLYADPTQPERLSYILATGEPDGEIRFTEVA